MGIHALESYVSPAGDVWRHEWDESVAARHHNVFLTVALAGLYLFVDKGYVSGEGHTLLVPY